MNQEQNSCQLCMQNHKSVCTCKHLIQDANQEISFFSKQLIQQQQQLNSVSKKELLQSKQDLYYDAQTNNSIHHSFLPSGHEYFSSQFSFEFPSQQLFSESYLGGYQQYQPLSFLFSTAQVQEDNLNIKELNQQDSSQIGSLLHIQLDDEIKCTEELQGSNQNEFKDSANVANFEIENTLNTQYLHQMLYISHHPSNIDQSNIGKIAIDSLHQMEIKQNNERDPYNDESQQDLSLYPNPSPSLSGSLKNSPNDEGDQENSSEHFNQEMEQEPIEECIRQKNKVGDLREEENISKEEEINWPIQDDHPKKVQLLSRIEDVNSSLWDEKCNEDDKYLRYLYSKMGKNNMVKNILQMFITFILERGDDVVVESLGYKEKELPKIRKELKNFLRKKNLNNNTLISFLKSQRYSKQFIYYLRFYAVEYFLESKVIDKSNHLICIAFFYRCKFNEDLLSSIIIYNKSKYFKSLNKNRLRNDKISEENQVEETDFKIEKIQSS